MIDEVAERGVGSAIGIVAKTGFAWYVIGASRRAFKRSDTALDLDGVIMKDNTDGSLIVVDHNTSGQDRNDG